jgi:hypothetical protein
MPDNFNVSRPTGRRRRLKTFDDDRMCASDGCDTRISKYNASDHCYAHTRPSYKRIRGIAAD